eukprot:TRINITY_DN14444_c0_g1_i2.p2 TRINITY_DN14444_c0_g1~~TRINITY_DN14444_c0_g1_i2.p2  ORF type:complete len:274 (-),score=45.62 TRINITY_DN14444_c0_g1_i2:15-836(-)
MLKSLPYSATNFKGFVYFNEDDVVDDKKTVEYSFQLNPYFWAKGRQQGKGNNLENLSMHLGFDEVGMIAKLTAAEAQLPIARQKIRINDSNISTRHSKIYFDQNQDKWMIQDLGSLNGTYIVVKDITLNPDQQKQILLYLGETLIKIQVQKTAKKAILIQFSILEGIGLKIQGSVKELELEAGQENIIGKKFFYPDESEQDSRISSKHLKITNQDNKTISIEDHCSLNGMMIRLSLRKEQSQPWELFNEDIISIIDRYEFLVNLKKPKMLKNK